MRTHPELASIVAAAAVAALCTYTTTAFAQVNQEAIDRVLAGETKVARASWWGFDPAEATKALQSAIDSGAEKVVVESMGSPWIVNQIRLASNQSLVFEEGVVVEAKRDAFQGTGDCLFTASLKENVTLTGYGATWRMHKADYAAPPYKKGEWRHCLSIRSCSNIRVSGLTLAESGGDGIYLGVAEKGVTNTDIHIKDVVCDSNYRQGISVISAENLLIEDCVLKNTFGTPPSAGIDFEPNDPTEKLVNCIMRNCLSEGNRGDGYEFYLKNLHGNSDATSIRLENCRSVSDSFAVRLATTNGHPDGDLQGLIEFVGCTFRDSRNAAILLSEKPASGCRTRFIDCVIANPAAENANESPIAFTTRSDDTLDLGGVEFVDCVVQDALDRQPMAFNDWAGSLGIVDVTGKLILERDGRRRPIILTEAQLAAWMPTLAFKKIPPFDDSNVRYQPLVESPQPDKLLAGAVRLRKQAALALYAGEGHEVSFTVRTGQVGQYAGKPTPVRVLSPAGDEVVGVNAGFQEDTTIAFTAPETGLYEVRIEPGQNTAHVLETSHPLCLWGQDQPIRLYRTTGDFFLWVPANVREFGIKVFGDNAGEGVKAALYDASGDLVEERDNITRPHQFVVERAANAPGEVWRLQLSQPSDVHMEDFAVELQGVPPLLAPTREALLAPADG